MASFSYGVPDDFLKQLQRLGDLVQEQELQKSMLNGAAPILVEGLRAECEAHVVTQDMKNSIKQTVKAKASSQGGYITIVRPKGVDKNGVRNMEKLAYLEYGTSHQPAEPVMQRVVNSKEREIVKKMQEIFDQEVKL